MRILFKKGSATLSVASVGVSPTEQGPALCHQVERAKCSTGRGCVFSGMRPSSGAETQGDPVAFGQSDPRERADVAAAEDGRTPRNTYSAARRQPGDEAQRVQRGNVRRDAEQGARDPRAPRTADVCLKLEVGARRAVGYRDGPDGRAESELSGYGGGSAHRRAGSAHIVVHRR